MTVCGVCSEGSALFHITSMRKQKKQNANDTTAQDCRDSFILSYKAFEIHKQGFEKGEKQMQKRYLESNTIN